MSQVLLKKIIQKKVPSAIPAGLEKADEFSIGKVFIHSKKPRKVIPMGRQDLAPAGTSLESLLAEDHHITISISKKLLFDTDKDKKSGYAEVDVTSDDTEIEAMLRKFPALEKALKKAGKIKTLQLNPDFGRVVQISSDLVQTVSRGSLQVQASHPVVKKAIENGGVMFIVSSLFEVQRCNVHVKVADKSADKQDNYTKVISHDQPTPLAYMLVKVSLDSNGKVTSVLNKQLSNKPKVSASKEPTPAEPNEDVDGMDEEAEYYLYSQKDFQPFESSTYSGIFEEAKTWVAPFLFNPKLQDALLTYTKPPHTYERLNELSGYFLEVGNAMRSKHPIPPNKVKDIDPIMNALSKDPDTRLDEITAVIIVAEAADEFPQHIVQMIIELPDDKRQQLLDLILKTPYESSRHVYIDEGPYKDPVLNPIMSRMGFSIPPNTHNLLHARRDFEDEEDTLAAALILMLGSEKK